jgi:TonB family protein
MKYVAILIFFCVFVSVSILPGFADRETIEVTPIGSATEQQRQALKKYSIEVIRHIRRTWFPPHDGNEHSIVDFDIAANGTISHVCLKQSSGKSSCDTPAVTAVKEASALPALPNGLLGVHVSLRFEAYAFMHLPRP